MDAYVVLDFASRAGWLILRTFSTQFFKDLMIIHILLFAYTFCIMCVLDHLPLHLQHPLPGPVWTILAAQAFFMLPVISIRNTYSEPDAGLQSYYENLMKILICLVTGNYIT
jgi:hypothetical protein